MLDFSAPAIQALIEQHGWRSLGEFERIRAIYNYVRDEILFGYNTDDSISASMVLADGYGQCNTKGTLFMVLLRSLPHSRLHHRQEAAKGGDDRTFVRYCSEKCIPQLGGGLSGRRLV